MKLYDNDEIQLESARFVAWIEWYRGADDVLRPRANTSKADTPGNVYDFHAREKSPTLNVIEVMAWRYRSLNRHWSSWALVEVITAMRFGEQSATTDKMFRDDIENWYAIPF